MPFSQTINLKNKNFKCLVCKLDGNVFPILFDQQKKGFMN